MNSVEKNAYLVVDETYVNICVHFGAVKPTVQRLTANIAIACCLQLGAEIVHGPLLLMETEGSPEGRGVRSHSVNRLSKVNTI